MTWKIVYFSNVFISEEVLHLPCLFIIHMWVMRFQESLKLWLLEKKCFDSHSLFLNDYLHFFFVLSNDVHGTDWKAKVFETNFVVQNCSTFLRVSWLVDPVMTYILAVTASHWRGGDEMFVCSFIAVKFNDSSIKTDARHHISFWLFLMHQKISQYNKW